MVSPEKPVAVRQICVVVGSQSQTLKNCWEQCFVGDEWIFKFMKESWRKLNPHENLYVAGSARSRHMLRTL